MARIKIVLLGLKGDLDKALKEIEEPIADAATAAMKEASVILKTEARANMAAAGFSTRWTNSFRSDYFPKGKNTSVEAAAIGYHKAGYAGVFEEGPTTISGKPLLWIPLSTTPKRVGNKRMTPALYVRTIGPLITIRRPGLPPLLAGKIATNRRGQANKSKVTLSALRRSGQAKATRLQPLFVGVPQVTIPDKFDVAEIAKRISGRIAELYFRNLRTD